LLRAMYRQSTGSAISTKLTSAGGEEKRHKKVRSFGVEGYSQGEKKENPEALQSNQAWGKKKADETVGGQRKQEPSKRQKMSFGRLKEQRFPCLKFLHSGVRGEDSSAGSARYLYHEPLGKSKGGGTRGSGCPYFRFGRRQWEWERNALGKKEAVG